MKYTVEQLKRKFKDFSSGNRVVLLLYRGKDGGKDRDSFHRNKRKITTNFSEFFKVVEEFMDFAKRYPNIPYRLYSTVNERNFDKTIREFKRRQLDNDYAEEIERNKFYVTIKDRFISCIMSPNVAQNKKFLIDIDTRDKRVLKEATKALKRSKVKIHLTYETINGYHIITDPFNPSEVFGMLDKLQTILIAGLDFSITDIKKDALILLNWKKL